MFGTQEINDDGILEIGGVSVKKLKEKYGTPLYVMDKNYIVEKAELIKKSFQSKVFKTEVAYASKAFLTVGMCKIVEKLDLCLDVVSGGEIYTALKAGFPMERAHFHGNSKSIDELEMAVEYGVGTIIVDNHLEFELLEDICGKKQKKINAILRVNPGIDAHTHEYIQTSKFDSKFGESIFMEETKELIRRIHESEWVKFEGLHAHIGSQIFDINSFLKEAEVMTEYIRGLVEEGIRVETLNLGGGYGIYYSDGDQPVDIELCLKEQVKIIEKINGEYNLGIKKLQIEPGRSLVANAGTTLYTVQGLKTTYSGKNYYFIDGGMTDNIRPALYQAVYSGTIGNRCLEEKENMVTVAGKCCESGDLILKDTKLQKAELGDVLCVFGTGAYNYSMASNYNKIPKPAVVMVENGESSLMVRRESYEDLIRNDL
ncbi:MAG: diaminopimelate decarboxylase [Psychrilyobacter sp.]|uniref:diaminopimelate decarboxylase n=1 Tax=Psychrilyobacter sp. TaxID=2586924 RepID=UPI003C7602DA